VKRTEIAIVGAPSTGALRLELSGCPGEDGLVLELLHDDRQTGTLARVVAGRVGLGEVSVPVAVKLQRDIALSQEDRGSVAAKFDKERNVHRRLQESPEDGSGQRRIVRQLEVWGGEAQGEADSLEPCILCARARHGLTPRCPECNDPSAVLEELQLTDDRGLRCSRCHRQFWSTPKTREAILEATLRHDPACRGCALERSPSADECRSSAVLLNFFRNRVLLLERLDLDLDDYLRWRRDEGASGARKAARRAFDEHRRLWLEQRERLPGPSVAKISELLMVANVFSDIVEGVEHLHRHGVAHLDLKPANICVRFRGPDLEVKIIDLGLSDDPHTLTYLRQAEGPLSLWTDYSAPEFRRPRARPIGVSGRFREDACELDWPCPETGALELPCAGDLLFFEQRDLMQQPFRVVHVRPAREDRVLVQARAEARYSPWLGEAGPLPEFGPESRLRTDLEVVLEKHCGFPADIYSLGMLLLAGLIGRPDVSDFREALPSVQIELEEHLCQRSGLPGRALVQRLLAEPSKHLQVFHAYARRLEGYGVAQPLAEELLGVVLRATLRGDPRVLYLSDRGGDARAALKRVRADLDAVRSALGNALTAAQAAAVHKARLGILDRLWGELQGRNGEAGAPPRPEAAARLIYPALDLGSAGDEHRQRELAYLAPAGAPPVAALRRWERELAGAEGDTPGSRRARAFLARYCRRVDPHGPAAVEFLKCYRGLVEKVVRANPSGDVAQAEERERVLRWVDSHQALAERLECGECFVELFRRLLAAVREKLLLPWDRGLGRRRYLVFRRAVAPVSLDHAGRAAILDEAAGTALQRLTSAVREGGAAARERKADFEGALAQWQAWCCGRDWVEGVARLTGDAGRQREVVEAALTVWEQGWGEAARRLRRFLDRLAPILEPFGKLAPDGEAATVGLARVQREGLKVEGAEDSLAWMQGNWPAPSERVEATFALWELDAVLS
jgi:hypothetical protein